MIPPVTVVELARKELENNYLKTEEHRPEYKDLTRLNEIRMKTRGPNTGSLPNPKENNSTKSTITMVRLPGKHCSL